MNILPGTKSDKDITDDQLRDLNLFFRTAKNVNMSDQFICKSTVDEILTKSIRNSYGAATSLGSLFTKLNDEQRNHNEKYTQYCVQILTSAIKSFSGDYRGWHNNCLNEITNKFNFIKDSKGCSLWTYGNSQKILNLSCKYVWVISKRLKELENQNPDFLKIGEKFLEIENELDVPIDSFIIEAIWNCNLENKKKFNIPTMKKISGPYYSNKVKSWSNWNKEDYDKFVESLHENFEIPLIWEGYAWTIIKKDRKYREGIKQMNKKDYKKAKNAFKCCKDYKDANKLCNDLLNK